MRLLTLGLLLSSIATISMAAPHNNHLEERQRDKTYTITCLNGPGCSYPPTTVDISTVTTIPGGGVPNPPNPPNPTTIPKSTSPKTTSTPTSKKTSATSRYTPPPENPPTKTVKSTQVPPTKTSGGEGGPSSTSCPVPLYYQCGGYYDGKPWSGCSKCVSGAKCEWQNDFYYQCVADEEQL